MDGVYEVTKGKKKALGKYIVFIKPILIGRNIYWRYVKGGATGDSEGMASCTANLLEILKMDKNKIEVQTKHGIFEFTKVKNK